MGSGPANGPIANLCSAARRGQATDQRQAQAPAMMLRRLLLIFALIGLIAALPPELIKTVAGLALMGAFMGALGSALSEDFRRFPAIVTLVVTASGLTLFGVGSAWMNLA